MRKILAIILAVTMLSGISVMASQKELEYNTGCYNITIFGAVPNDDKDDTEAFEKAFEKASAVYLPEGEYLIRDTISFGNKRLLGAGSDKTIITADIEDPYTPILNPYRTSTIEGITIRYKDGLVTGQEMLGQRVGIVTSGKYRLQRGSRITDVTIENVGTGIISGMSQRKDEEVGYFSVTWEGLTVKDFSYRGIHLDYTPATSTGDYYNDIVLSSGKYRADSALYLYGGESEEIYNKITIKDTIAENPLYINNREGFIANEIIMDNVYALHGPLVTWNNSVGKIDMLYLDYSDVHFNENPLILIADSQNVYDNNSYNRNGLHIGTLSLNSYNSAMATEIFRRAERCYHPFYITIDKYEVTNSDFDWFDFPTSEDRLVITKKGEIATEGPTRDRPDQCLCPYYSTYYDTDLQKLLVWNGEEWK